MPSKIRVIVDEKVQVAVLTKGKGLEAKWCVRDGMLYAGLVIIHTLM